MKYTSVIALFLATSQASHVEWGDSDAKLRAVLGALAGGSSVEFCALIHDVDCGEIAVVGVGHALKVAPGRHIAARVGFVVLRTSTRRRVSCRRRNRGKPGRNCAGDCFENIGGHALNVVLGKKQNRCPVACAFLFGDVIGC